MDVPILTVISFCRFEKSQHADVYLAASAGNSVRRSVSQGSAQFIAGERRPVSTHFCMSPVMYEKSMVCQARLRTNVSK
jgi:hypothetical protein